MIGTTLTRQTEVPRLLPDSLKLQSRLTLTLRDARGWHTFKGTLQSRCESSQTFLVALQVDPKSSARPEVHPEDVVGVTYRDGKRKCIFAAPLVSIHWDTASGEAILQWPVTVQHLRRRAFDRVDPPRGRSVTVRLRPHDAHASSSIVRDVSEGRLLDISVGGLRIAVSNHRHFEPDTTYRCSFTPREGRPVIVFDANVLHCGAGDDGQAVVGLRIVGLETESDGSRTLDRLARVVEYFQRAASRRKS